MEHQPLNSPIGVKKNDIWAAYKEAVAELKSKDNGTVSTVEVAKQAKLSEAISTAEQMTTDGVIAFTENFAVDLKAAKDEYEQLKEAITAKKAELKAVHDLEFTANSTIALIAAKDRVIAEKEEQAKGILETARAQAEDIRNDADAYAETKKKDAAERFQADEKERKRKREEWEYAFARERTAKTDEAQDLINVKAKAITERENDVKAREEAAEEKDAEVTRIKTEMEELNNSIQEKIKAAEGKARGMAEREAKQSIALLNAEHKGLTDRLESEKANLLAQIGILSERASHLEQQVTAANERVTSIATGALKAGADAATITEVAKTVAAGQKGK